MASSAAGKLRLAFSNPDKIASRRLSLTSTSPSIDTSPDIREMVEALRHLSRKRPEQAAHVVALVKRLARASGSEP